MSEASWWTAPLEDDNGHLIMVTGREDVEKFRSNPRFNIRVTITHPYKHTTDGMPDEEDSAVLDDVLTRLQAELKADPVAVITGIYTGADERTLVIYTKSVNIFNKKLNLALAPLPLLPFQITAENDPDWEEYDEMNEAGQIFG